MHMYVSESVEMSTRYNYILCRLCLYKSECLSDIFEDSGSNGFTAAEIISDLLQYNVSKTDGYPQYVCLECFDKLLDFKVFKDRCNSAKSTFETNFHPNISHENIFTTNDTLHNDFRKINKGIEFYESKNICDGPKSAIEFCDVILKTEVEDYEKEAAQQKENLFEEGNIPCSVQIKEEGLDLSNTEAETSPVIPIQLDETDPRWGKKLFKCTVCHAQFLQKRKFNAHMKEHGGTAKFHPCEVCGKKFKAKGSLTEHRRIHSGEKPYECKFCGKCFRHIRSHQKHVVRVHNEKQYQCEWCPMKFCKKETLASHVRIHIRGKPFECGRCGKRFSFASSLSKHRALHSEDGEAPFECADCGKTFDHKKRLGRHVKNHGGERPFGCELCDKRFLQKSGLSVHMTLHSGEKAFMCDECGKKFRKKRNLTIHKRVHSGERPFQCEICDKRFTQKGSLNAHKKLHNEHT